MRSDLSCLVHLWAPRRMNTEHRPVPFAHLCVENPQGWKPHNLSGSLFQLVTVPMGKHHPYSKPEPLLLQPVLVVSHLPTMEGKDLYPSSRRWEVAVRSPKTIPSPGWTRPVFSTCPHPHVLQPYHHPDRPSLDLLEVSNAHLVPGPQNWRQCSRCGLRTFIFH